MCVKNTHILFFPNMQNCKISSEPKGDSSATKKGTCVKSSKKLPELLAESQTARAHGSINLKTTGDVPGDVPGDLVGMVKT